MKVYKSYLVLAFILISGFLFGQDDSLKTRSPVNFTGSVTVTTKGISTVPNLTLGKPAAIFEFSIGRRLSFDPNMRFALEGRPWSFFFLAKTLRRKEIHSINPLRSLRLCVTFFVFSLRR